MAAFVAAGVMFVTSSINAHGSDLRASSVSDLDTLLLQQRAHVDGLQEQVARLNAQVVALTKQVGDTQVNAIQAKVDRLKGPAQFESVTGSGVTVSLNDAPKSVIDQAVQSGAVTADALVVHQQDIQAVVNALWHGGAEAITLQGQRLISTTGIKCVGNTVVLRGVPYSPPYVISAIGDRQQLLGELHKSAYVAAYLTFVHRYELGWKLTSSPRLDLPGYVGVSDLRYAKPDTSALSSSASNSSGAG